MIEEIKLSQKIYQCRETAKKLYGDKYEAKVADYKRYIKAAMVKHSLDSEMQGALKLIEDCQGLDGSDIATMNILAACVELIEEKTK